MARQRQEPFKPHAIKVAECARARMNGVQETTDPDELEAARIADIRQWKDHVVDLHRVFSVAEAMFLLLEHNNEALLRVAVEIVCCATSQKVLWWNIGWYSDEKRRSQFREMVSGYLNKCMAYLSVQPVDTSAQIEEARQQAEALHQYQKQCAEAEASRKAMEHRNGLLEIQIRDLEAALADAASREKDLKKANQNLQNELRDSQDSEAAKALAAQIAELKSKLSTSEEQKLTATEKLRKLEAHAQKLEEEVALTRKGDAEAARAKMSEAEKKIEAEQARANAAEKRLQESEKEINALRDALKKAEADSQKAPARKVEADPERIKSLEESLQEQKRIVEEYSEQLDPLKRALMDTLMNPTAYGEGDNSDGGHKKSKSSPGNEKSKNSPEQGKESSSNSQISANLGRGKDSQSTHGASQTKEVPNRLSMESSTGDFLAEIKRLQAIARRPPVVVERVVERTVEAESPSQKNQIGKASSGEESDRRKKQFDGVSQEEFEAKCSELEKAKAKNATLRTKLGEVQEEKEQLQERSDKMLKLLHQLKEQLKRVTAIANKRGFGQLVDSILDEAHVSETLESPEFTVCDRLYEDAKRRQEKQRQWEEARLGGPKLPLARQVVGGQAGIGANLSSSAATHRRASESQIPNLAPDGGYHNVHRSSLPDVPSHGAWGSPVGIGTYRDAPSGVAYQPQGSDSMRQSEASGVEVRAFRPSSPLSNESFFQHPRSLASNVRPRSPASPPSKKLQSSHGLSLESTMSTQVGDSSGEFTFASGLSVSGLGVGTPSGSSSEPLTMWGSSSEPLLRYERASPSQTKLQYERPYSSQKSLLRDRPMSSPKGLLQPSFSAPSLRPRLLSEGKGSVMSLDIQGQAAGSPIRSGSASPAEFRKLMENRSAARLETDVTQHFRPGSMRGNKLTRRHGKVVGDSKRPSPKPFSLEDPF